MIRTINGKTPRIAESAFVSEAAYIVGDVEIGEGTSVWPGAVIRGDLGPIKIGSDCAVEDNCVIHVGSPDGILSNLNIGDRVVIGHGAVLNCIRIGNDVLIGMNATILHDVEIGNDCIIAAGCVVREKMIVPDDSFVLGVPGEIKGKPSQDHLWWIQDSYKAYVRLTKQYKKEGL